MGTSKRLGKAMANYPQELAQDAVCQSHTGHMTGLWFLPTRSLRLITNECMNITLLCCVPNLKLLKGAEHCTLLTAFLLPYCKCVLICGRFEFIIKKRANFRFVCALYLTACFASWNCMYSRFNKSVF